MIDILLPTFNSENFLDAQLQSIFDQTFIDFKLIIIDDASSDKTTEIIQQWQTKYPDRIQSSVNDTNHGIINTINKLLTKSTANYIMFCDHDDVWFNNKIEQTLDLMKKTESRYGSDTPILIHTDLDVVDAALKNSKGSFFKLTGINPQKKGFNRMLMQNTVTGCTTMINRALINITGKIPENAIMHDWWLALVAAAFGHIETLNCKTLYYRQHQRNEIGAKKLSISSGVKKGKSGDISKSLTNLFTQAEVFSLKYASTLSKEKTYIINSFASLPSKSFMQKRMVLIRNGFYKQGILRNAGLFIFI